MAAYAIDSVRKTRIESLLYPARVSPELPKSKQIWVQLAKKILQSANWDPTIGKLLKIGQANMTI